MLTAGKCGKAARVMSFSSKKESRSARQKKSLVGTEPLTAENEHRNGNSTGDIIGIEKDGKL